MKTIVEFEVQPLSLSREFYEEKVALAVLGTRSMTRCSSGSLSATVCICQRVPVDDQDKVLTMLLEGVGCGEASFAPEALGTGLDMVVG